jgi:hypothetical protein
MDVNKVKICECELDLLAQDGDLGKILVNTVMNLRAP